MKDHFKLEIFYPHPPERVWKALTDPGALGKWLMPTDFKPEIGLRFRFNGLNRGERNEVNGVVLDVEPNRHLSYTWLDDEGDSPGVVSWTLCPVDGGTRVQLEHLSSAHSNVCARMEVEANWSHSVVTLLPTVIRAFGAEGRYPPVPMVYVVEDREQGQQSKRRAGFRQEDVLCSKS